MNNINFSKFDNIILIFELTCKIRFLDVNIDFVISFTVLIGFVLRIWSLTVENVKYKKYIIIVIIIIIIIIIIINILLSLLLLLLLEGNVQ